MPEILDRIVKVDNYSLSTKFWVWLRRMQFHHRLLWGFNAAKVCSRFQYFFSKKGSKHVAIAGGTFQESITATFGASYANKFKWKP